jgi:hypothetical protein
MLPSFDAFSILEPWSHSFRFNLEEVVQKNDVPRYAPTAIQFFVEGDGMRGECFEADNAYDAKAKFIYALVDRAVKSLIMYESI